MFWESMVTIDSVNKSVNINIIDFFTSNPEYFQQSFVTKATNVYISTSFKRFVKESYW